MIGSYPAQESGYLGESLYDTRDPAYPGGGSYPNQELTYPSDDNAGPYPDHVPAYASHLAIEGPPSPVPPPSPLSPPAYTSSLPRAHLFASTGICFT